MNTRRSMLRVSLALGVMLVAACGDSPNPAPRDAGATMCGQFGQTCCGPEVGFADGCATGLICSGGFCAEQQPPPTMCGISSGSACCADQTCMGAGLVCCSGACLVGSCPAPQCGGLNQACCTDGGAQCTAAGTTCQGSLCVMDTTNCGQMAGPCNCPGGTCAGELICNVTVCEMPRTTTCVELGEPCTEGVTECCDVDTEPGECVDYSGGLGTPSFRCGTDD